MNLDDQVRKYLSSDSRNKIVVHQSRIPGIHYGNVGYDLSSDLTNCIQKGNITMKTLDALDQLLEGYVVPDNCIGKYIAIENLGLLFEPELKIDLTQLLSKYSKFHPIFLRWDGDVDRHILFFLSKETGVKIDLSHLSYIRV